MADISKINIGSSDYNIKDATARSSISQIDAKLASKADIGHTHDGYISVDAEGNAAIQGTFSALGGINATEGEAHAQKFVIDDMGKLGTSDQILLGDGSTTSLSELTNQLNTAGLAITGVLNMTKLATMTSLLATATGMKNGEMKFYLIGDSSGSLTNTSETYVTFHSSVAALFGKSSSMGASVGDVLMQAKLNGLGVYRVLPLNDAKPANGSFPGCDGLETIWDKTQINKIPSIETISNNAIPRSEVLPNRGATNMNEALETGIYPWCTLGRPTGATGAFTCITKKSSNKDGNGYYTIEQTAYGRTNELGQVFKRIIFISDSDALWGDWERIDSSQAISDISNLSSKIDNSCFKCYYGEFNMRNCGEDGVYMYGTSDKPLGSIGKETFSLIVSEAGKNVTYGGSEYAYVIRQVAYSNIRPERIFTRLIFTNNKNIEAIGNVTVWEEWERVNKYLGQEEDNVNYFSTGNWYMTNEAMNTNPYLSQYGRKLTFRDYLILKFDPNRLSKFGSKRNIYIKFYRWLSRRNKSSRRPNNSYGRERIHKYGSGWVAMPALTELGFERQKEGFDFGTVFTGANNELCDFRSFNRNMKLEINPFQDNFSCFIKSGEGKGYGAQYGINLSKIFNGYDDGSVALWGLKRMILMNFIPCYGRVTWGGGKPSYYWLGGGGFPGNYGDYNQRHSVIIGLQIEYRDPNTSEVTTISPLLPFRVYVYSNSANDGDKDVNRMLEEGSIKIDIIPFNKGYI